MCCVNTYLDRISKIGYILAVFTHVADGEMVGQVSRLAQYKNLLLRNTADTDKYPSLVMLGELALVTDVVEAMNENGADVPLGLIFELQDFAEEICKELAEGRNIMELFMSLEWNHRRRESDDILAFARGCNSALRTLEFVFDRESMVEHEDEREEPIEHRHPIFIPTQEMRASAKREETLREDGRRVRRRASEDEADESNPKRSLRDHRRANAELEALI